MNISDAFRNVRIDTKELRSSMKALRNYARTRYAQGGITPQGKPAGTPLKLHGAEGYVRVGGKLYYWKEVEETP